MMKYITIIRAAGREMTDNCHAAEADAIAHATRLAARLEPAYHVAVVECRRVTTYQHGNAIFYRAGTGDDVY